MPTGVITWSQTAASNSNADSNVNWAEGMAPSQVNDSARAVMASVAKWRDDNTGTLTSSGTGAAYTVASNTGFASLAAMDGQTLVVKFHTTNTSTATTLNVDSLGAKSLTFDGTNAITQSLIFTNTINEVVYNNSLGVFIIKALGPSPYWGAATITGQITLFGATPNGNYWIQCNGAAVSRTTFANLFLIIGTTYGAGDGSTTFNVPNIASLGSVPYFIHV